MYRNGSAVRQIKIMRLIATYTLIGMMAVVVMAFALVSTSKVASANFSLSPDGQVSGRNVPLSANRTVDCAKFTAVCLPKNPDSRRRGLGFWLIYGVWIAIRWFALLVWGIWQWALAVIGGIIVIFIAVPMARKIFGSSKTS